jgi:bifunctional DNA-binding transcriptional regulator/antitoxin component of YhaV-PrlF toxin-antitoxin module
MRAIHTLAVSEEGEIVLPKALRDRHSLKAGEKLQLIDLGGVFVLSRRKPGLSRTAGKLRKALEAQGETFESMLSALREERGRRT